MKKVLMLTTKGTEKPTVKHEAARGLKKLRRREDDDFNDCDYMAGLNAPSASGAG